jgi:hypothetical protein
MKKLKAILRLMDIRTATKDREICDDDFYRVAKRRYPDDVEFSKFLARMNQRHRNELLPKMEKKSYDYLVTEKALDIVGINSMRMV